MDESVLGVSVLSDDSGIGNGDEHFYGVSRFDGLSREISCSSSRASSRDRNRSSLGQGRHLKKNKLKGGTKSCGDVGNDDGEFDLNRARNKLSSLLSSVTTDERVELMTGLDQWFSEKLQDVPTALDDLKHIETLQDRQSQEADRVRANIESDIDVEQERAANVLNGFIGILHEMNEKVGQSNLEKAERLKKTEAMASPDMVASAQRRNEELEKYAFH